MGKIAAGCTVAQTECRSDPAADEAMPPHSWSQVKADKFNVRQGPDYGLQKRKARSVGPPLYQLCGVDWYRSGSRLEGVGGLADLPRAEFSHPSVPSLLIVNVQLPLEVSVSLDSNNSRIFYFVFTDGAQQCPVDSALCAKKW